MGTIEKSDKQFGLIDPKAKKKMTVANVFGNDSDSGGELGGKDWIKKKMQSDVEGGVKKQTAIDMNRALEQDPTVYQYDEIYDTMKEKMVEATKEKVEKKAKYMDALIKTADKRKKENERRTQRLVQKEREAEGDQFKDKEEFITSSYRQKLEEMKKTEEEEKRMEYIESITDVTKQKDLGSFYRHLYKEADSSKIVVTPEEVASDSAKTKEVKEEAKGKDDDLEPKEKVATKESSSSDSSDSDSSSSSSSDTSSDSDDNEKKDTGKEGSALEDGEVLDEKEEKEKEQKSKVLEIQEKQSIIEPPSKVAKFETREKKDRNYRQRDSSANDQDSKKSSTSRTSDVRSTRDRENERDFERRKREEKERNRDKERREERSGRNDRRSDLHSRYSREDSRRRRSRSRDRREPEKKRSPRRDEKEKRDRHEGEKQESHRKIVKEKNSRKDGDVKKEFKVEKKDTDKEKKASVSKPTTENGKGEKQKEENDVKQDKIQELPKVNIWAKRTVGSVFEAALERYYQRKAARGL